MLTALVDCNSFYASCERVFRPDLRKRPVAVLSNNDGCIVAMSREVKELGIRRGAPYFEVARQLERAGVSVFSSNYTLYQDLSSRVMTLLGSYAPGELQAYSIDEAFLLWEEHLADPELLSRTLVSRVLRETGIPISMGVARTKTLAKLANHQAKGREDSFYHLTEDREDALLEATPVGEIWGIGRRKRDFLRKKGILTAAQLRDCDDSWVKKELTLVTLRTVHELRGLPAVLEEDLSAPKKGIISSRSFSHPVSSFGEMMQSVALYCEQAVQKLNRQDSLTGEVWLLVAGNRFKENCYSASQSIKLSVPTDYLPDITAAARILLRRLYRDGHSYIKTGVGLLRLSDKGGRQQLLFEQEAVGERNTVVQETVRQINTKADCPLVAPLSAGFGGSWEMRREFLSPRYTTRWGELPRVY